MSESQISKLENGEIEPQLATLQPVCVALKAPVDVLFNLWFNVLGLPKANLVEFSGDPASSKEMLAGQAATWVKRLLVENNFKQSDLTRITGVSQGFISPIVNQKKSPKIGTIKQLAKVEFLKDPTYQQAEGAPIGEPDSPPSTTKVAPGSVEPLVPKGRKR